MPEQAYRSLKDAAALLCGRVKQPDQPTCRRKDCREVYATAVEAAYRSEERREAKRPKGRRGKLLAMGRRGA
jgi:hypothetical protein